MKRRRKKAEIQGLLLFSRRDQVRFVQAVEKLCSLVNDLETLLAPVKRRRAAKRPLAVDPSPVFGVPEGGGS